MTLTLTEEQSAIVEATARLLAERSNAQAMRAAAQGESGVDRDLWQRIAELGLCGIQLPAEHGGLGLGVTELALVAEELGRRLACVPWFETVALAAGLLLEAGAGGARWLESIASGELIATVALGAAGVQPAAPALRAHALGAQGWRLEGRCAAVPAAASAALLLLPALDAQQRTLLFAVPRETHGLGVTPQPNHDLTRRLATVELRAAELPAAACLLQGEAADAALARVTQAAAVVLAAEQVGVAQQCLDLTVAYTLQREQFGRPIAAFQALKHRCAQMMVAVEGARSSVRGAARAFDDGARGPGRVFHAALARSEAAAAARACAQEAIQLHGGVGFTWEFDPHLYFKRAQAASAWLGPVSDWREHSAAWLLDDAPAAFFAPARDEDAASAAFRAEVVQWMQQHLRGAYAPLRFRGGAGDPDYDPELGKLWERELASGGWVGLGWPRAHGGRDLPLERQVIFHEEYVRCGGPGRIGHIGETLLAPTLIAFGTPQQKQRFLPGILAGTEYWAQGYSEPGAGSDLAGVRTRARREGDQWVIDGQKIWTSWARESDWIFVLARTEPESSRHQGLTLLLVPLAQPGITIRPIRQMNGASEFNEVFFDGARTEAGLHLGAVGAGWKVAMALLGFERGVSTLGQQAHFEHELQGLLAVARRGAARGDALLRQRIAEAAFGLAKLRFNALRVLGAQQDAPTRESYVAKYLWSNWHRDFGQLAADVLGLDCDPIDADEAAQRLRQVWLWSRADTIYAGTNEIQLNLIAERALGMPR